MKWKEMKRNEQQQQQRSSQCEQWIEWMDGENPKRTNIFNEASAAAADTWNMLFTSRSKKGKIHFSIFISMENEYEN